MTATSDDRAQRFTQELEKLKIPDPAAARSQLWVRLGVAAMVVGVALGVIAYLMSHNTSDPLIQRDALTIALTGVAVAIVGSAVFVRYSLTNFLRFWLARQSFDLNTFGERLAPAPAPVAGKHTTAAKEEIRNDHESPAAARG
ncbi:hypothetical protein [Gordonia sp. SL306]|uniref:hypothetical protein n=1 Tax=Gordonia sp. SL306 TaxID=2995145 RepID=UPI002272282A|nr:hypothetical protein [Gordonia sp. SL306]WAC54144.1 hypothetical protein OVA31_15765 [Gordonia sp. SL306]